MKKLFLLAISLSSCLILTAQPKYFEKSLGWQSIHNGWVIFERTDGNYFVSCDATGSVHWNNYSFILDKFGNVIDSTHHSLPSSNDGVAVIDGITTEYGYATAGYIVNNSITSQAYFLKLTPDGAIIDTFWVGQLPAALSYTLCRTPDGGYMLGGSVRQYSGNNFTTYPYLIRLNEQGEVVWDTMYQLPNILTGTTNAILNMVADETDGSYYALLILNVGNETSDAMWCHIDWQGNIIDQRIIGTIWGQMESPRSIIRTIDGNWLISYMIYEEGSGDCISGRIIKLSTNGDTILWDKELWYYGYITKIQELPDGSFIVGGEASPLPDYAFNATIAHVSANGDSIYWQRSYGGAGDDDYIYDFTPTSDGGYFFVGRTETNVPGANVYLLKTNCMGLLTEPQAQYSYTNPQGNTIAFQNLSQYTYPDSIDGGHYLWDFGDGFNSNEQNPTHTYAQAGIYLAKLTAIVCQDTSIMYQSICIGTSAHPAPSFTHTLQNDTLVSFTNTSSNAQNAVFVWDFGDGSPPTQTITQQALQHSYSQAGEHQVTLSVIMCQDTTVYTQVVNTWAVGMQVLPLEEGLEGGLCTVLPNPANEQISISPPSGGWGVQTHTFVLYDVLGKAVLQKALSPTTTQIPTEHLPSGIYLYQIIDPQNQTLQYGKISIMH